MIDHTGIGVADVSLSSAFWGGNNIEKPLTTANDGAVAVL